MELFITGNRDSYQISRKITPIELRLIGNYNSKMTLFYENTPLVFENGPDFYRFGERIKGGSITDICFALTEYFPENGPFMLEFSKKSYTEVSLFKAVFLIYNWVEIAYTDAYAVSLGSKIYDEFIIDYNSKPGTQEDIYFIKQELITEKNKPYLDWLIKINLLTNAIFKGGNLGEYNAYFIPLVKPGVQRENFKHVSDNDGSNTFNLWKRILSDRDTKISSWYNNRFKP